MDTNITADEALEAEKLMELARVLSLLPMWFYNPKEDFSRRI